MAWATPELLAWIQRIETRAPTATLFELLGVGSNADSATIVAAFHRIGQGAHPDLHRGALEPGDAERHVSAYGKVAAAYDTLRDPAARDRYRKELAERGRAVSKPPVIGGSKSTSPPRGVATTTGGRGLGGTPGSTGSNPAIGRTPTGPRGPSASLAPGQSGSMPAIGRTPTPSGAKPPGDPRAPLITPAVSRTTTASRGSSPPGAPRRTGSITAAGSSPPPASQTGAPTLGPRGESDSRPPQGSIAPRATVYFRKAQGCLARGDLGGALFNLRLASAADPTSSVLRVALAEVEAEIAGKK